LIVNVWLSVKRPPLDKVKEFPYKALNPVTHQEVLIESNAEIDRILMDCYVEAINKGYDIGEALYNQLFFFTDPIYIYNEDCQNLIKKYVFCDNFNCPPYPSLQETPAELVDNFLLIKKELSNPNMKEK
jgi:hypothetical protein|tara:strand:+ start:1721 stop:2107 length:387 start_codon:yes stop_codon:yes gene_type:complete